MRRTVVALCVLSFALPAAAALRPGPDSTSARSDSQHRSDRRTRPDSLSAETSANGAGWKQFVTGPDGRTSAALPVRAGVAPELVSWAVMISGIGIAGSLLRGGSPRKI